jgi:two-component system phosphate regulon response regulator OmpR
MSPYPDLPHVLVVDDDRRLRELLRRFLSENELRVTSAEDAADARAKLAGFDFDLMILDVMMPGETGLELAAALREAQREVPILLLTARAEAEDRISGLELGAEDYLAKPFEPRELLLRIRTILRRREAIPATPPVRSLRFGDLVFDLEREQLSGANGAVRLTSSESTLLGLLARHAGRTLAREDLSRMTGNGGNVRTVDVQVTRLRRKIEMDPKFPRYLQTVWGRGYVLRPD